MQSQQSTAGKNKKKNDKRGRTKEDKYFKMKQTNSNIVEVTNKQQDPILISQLSSDHVMTPEILSVDHMTSEQDHVTSEQHHVQDHVTSAQDDVTSDMHLVEQDHVTTQQEHDSGDHEVSVQHNVTIEDHVS